MLSNPAEIITVLGLPQCYTQLAAPFNTRSAVFEGVAPNYTIQIKQSIGDCVLNTILSSAIDSGDVSAIRRACVALEYVLDRMHEADNNTPFDIHLTNVAHILSYCLADEYSPSGLGLDYGGLARACWTFIGKGKPVPMAWKLGSLLSSVCTNAITLGQDGLPLGQATPYQATVSAVPAAQAPHSGSIGDYSAIIQEIKKLADEADRKEACEFFQTISHRNIQAIARLLKGV